MLAVGTALLETKCPSSRRSRILIDIITQATFVKYIRYENGRLTLRKSHPHFTQFKLVMYLASVKECFLFVYSQVQIITIVVERHDELLCSAVGQLETFLF